MAAGDIHPKTVINHHLSECASSFWFSRFTGNFNEVDGHRLYEAAFFPLKVDANDYFRDDCLRELRKEFQAVISSAVHHFIFVSKALRIAATISRLLTDFMTNSLIPVFLPFSGITVSS